MFDFIIQLVIVGSLGAIIVILGRALPRVEEYAETSDRRGIIDRMMGRVPMSAIDSAIASFLEKALRKVRVVNLKIENWVNDGIQRLRGSKNEKSKTDANELFEKK